MITTDIASRLSDFPSQEVIATSLVTLALCTSLLGICLVVIGKCKLAKLVGYLPVPVVGGYLAFIGFCRISLLRLYV